MTTGLNSNHKVEGIEEQVDDQSKQSTEKESLPLKDITQDPK